MGYQDGMDALNLKMPNKIPRTEYSASRLFHSLQKAVTGIDVTPDSDQATKDRATGEFEKAWDYGISWAVHTHAQIFKGHRTTMGHAVYTEGGSDYRNEVKSPFKDSDDVLNLDFMETYGVKEKSILVNEYNQHYKSNCILHPHSVNMTGIYVSLVSGLIDCFGWQLMLEAMGDDMDMFGDMTDRYAQWIQHWFNALAESDSPVVMVHDDIVWGTGPFANPTWYREHVFPNYEKLLDPLKKAGKKILYTCDGNFDFFLDDIVACGVDGLVMEPGTDMGIIAKKYGQKLSFVGNADCRVLTHGTNEEIKAEVKRCIDIGRDCPGFIMAVGNHIPPNVPIEKAIYYNDVFQEMAYRR